MATSATHATSTPVGTKGRANKSLTEQAYDKLRGLIITCQIQPRMEVSEQELTDRFAMSTPHVREALMRLCLEGLVESFPRRGYRIAPVTIKAINDQYLRNELPYDTGLSPFGANGAYYYTRVNYSF